MKGFLRAVLPVVALAIGLAASGCDGPDVIVDADGVPLSELDLASTVPTKLVLAGPDLVTVTEGAKLAITVTGDQKAADSLRFKLEKDTLAIMRTKDWSDEKGRAVVAVIMPAASQIVMAGSGRVEAPVMASEAEVVVAGSGEVSIARLAAKSLSVKLVGSGGLEAAGSAESLDFNILGSGNLKARALKIDTATINIAGSGGGEFASDGKVEAKVAGSGNVTVVGRADCKISAMGSGKLRCRPADGGWEDAAPEPPAAPAAPKAPKAKG